jgi:hypothetical protein
MGMRSITRSNQPVTPASVISAPQTTKAPTASAIEKPPAEPGGDQHRRARRGPGHHDGLAQYQRGDGRAQAHAQAQRPHPRADEPGVALNACAAWNTMATELVKPTSTATKPAVKADRLKSLKNRMAPILPGTRHQR